MIDPQYIRDNPEELKEWIKKRANPEKANVDRWLELDSKRAGLISRTDELRRERNELSGKFRDSGEKEKLRAEVNSIKEELSVLEKELREVEEEWQEIQYWIPNLPVDIPDGEGEQDNVILRLWTPKSGYVEEASGMSADGSTKKYMPQNPYGWNSDKKPVHHQDIGLEMGIIDNVQSAKVSGSRFTYLLGDLVLVQYAVQQLMYEKLLGEGFTPLISPLLVKERALYGTSHFPEGRDQVYSIETDYVEDKEQLHLLGSTAVSYTHLTLPTKRIV